MATVAIVGALAVTLGLTFSLDRAMMFPAKFAGALPPPPPDVEVIDTPSGLAWFVPAESDIPAPVIFLFHGNGEHIANRLPDARAYQSRGLSVALVEYPGYGGTAGSPSQASISRTAEEAYDAITARSDVDATRVLVHGFSIGGGVGAQLADARKVHALILESTFRSMVAMYRSMRLPGFLCRDPFRTDRVLESYEGHVLLIHGRRDDIVPIEHSRRLHEIVPQATLLELDNGHNDGPSDPVAYWAAIDSVINSIDAATAGLSSEAVQPRSGDGPR
ncbi:MAG: alpha/beta hydrolase [Phycisphaerales bacterium]